jgi:DNA-binding beta-propeller fold protein YncE
MLCPFAVCTDDGSRVFVADASAQVVHVFDLLSRKYSRWVPPEPLRFSQPVGLAWDPRGRLFVSDSVGGCIFVFTYTGSYEARIGVGELGRPAGLAWDARHNRLLVADAAGHCIVSLSADGAVLGRTGRRGTLSGQFNYPTNIVVDHQGRIYVSDTLNFRIQQFDSNLRPTLSIGYKGDTPGCLASPKGIAVDSEDHLYVVDAQFEALQVFDPQGQLLLSFGEEGRGPGEFWLPAGLCIDARNRIWVADAYNRRLQVFDYLPEKQP